jgi:KipI family sensor histidine kinase inhibitor
MSGLELRRVGDHATLLELEDETRVAVVARRLADGCPGAIDVVPGHRTVLVRWSTPPGPRLRRLAEEALASAAEPAEWRTVEIPVAYDGPDLDEVAVLTGLSAEEVVRRHLAATYRVAFLGFAPGFAYLVGGDERLSVPRRAEPRQQVAAGTVAIAGPYTGIYPRDSPGGWRLLGRTDAVLFDASRSPPATLEPGDRVRMVHA